MRGRAHELCVYPDGNRVLPRSLGHIGPLHASKSLDAELPPRISDPAEKRT